MIITSISEDKSLEKRIAITPEIAKKYILAGFEVCIVKDYGNHLGFFDNDYKNLGVKILDKETDVINSADVIIQLGLPSEDKFSNFKESQILIGVLDPFLNESKLKKLNQKNVKSFVISMQFIPI